ncbi:MAG: ThuA domain-containing protein [Pseudomonadota bacterium]
MSIIDYSASLRLLVTARGHPYQRDAFAELLDSLDGVQWSLAEQPAAQYLFNPALRDRFDACLCYDMPGVNFTSEDPPTLVSPDDDFCESYLGLLEAGMGMVFLHHSIAAWPAWPEYAEIVGGRFHYRPASLRGQPWPDSGYRHKVEHSVTVQQRHPVTDGLPASFRMCDELYLCPVFEDKVEPLLASDYQFVDRQFYSAQRAVAGDMHSREGWTHPPGSSLVAWVKHYRNSPLVYIQGGDDAEAYGDAHFQRLISNAVRWVSSEGAHAWARQRNQQQAGGIDSD